LTGKSIEGVGFLDIENFLDDFHPNFRRSNLKTTLRKPTFIQLGWFVKEGLFVQMHG